MNNKFSFIKATMVKSAKILLLLLAYITQTKYVTCQDPNTGDVTPFYENIENEVQGDFSSETLVDDIVVTETNSAVIPEELKSLFIKNVLIWVGKKMSYYTTISESNRTFIKNHKKLSSKVEYCLFESSGDLPKHVKKELVECVTEQLEDSMQVTQDIVKEVRYCLKMVIKLFKKLSKCKTFRCLHKSSSKAGDYIVAFVSHTGYALYHTILLSSITMEMPLCFSEVLTHQTGTQAVNMMIDILQCI